MKYLQLEEKSLKEKGALFTAKEINGQPELWQSIYKKLISEKNDVQNFLDSVLPKVDKIIFTGAGTSGFIGYSLEGAWLRKKRINNCSIATTHIVSHPEDYFDNTIPILLISFARSGNSPESVEAVKLANKHCGVCYHLIITCNEDGALAKLSDKNSFAFILPPEANDNSLAMTGSYSGMLLAALLINDIDDLENKYRQIKQICNYGTTLLNTYLEKIRLVSKMNFTRAVFLGSGPQFGTATESHLKLQELTDGQVICKNDSYLGFRHGPKAVVDESTLIVYFFSNKPSCLLYERDLVLDMANGKKPLFQIGVSEKDVKDIKINEVFVFSDDDTSKEVPEAYLSVPSVLLGQLLGFYKALDLGFSPDSPSKSGSISRVVKGVVIY